MILEEFDMGFGYRGYWEMEGVLPGNSNTLIEALREFYAPASMKATLQRQPNSQPNGLENAIRTEPESFWRPGGELGTWAVVGTDDAGRRSAVFKQSLNLLAFSGASPLPHIAKFPQLDSDIAGFEGH
ncbi:hypothetical protein LOZ43_005507 [Ophidiomyces ophidiicola]|nr:hypothetical protein LOZ43_005507 [Ophidiomyces ophidiicola]